MSQDSSKGGISRRDFLKVIGVAGGTAAVTGACSSEPVEQLIPYVIPPENFVPGVPNYYSSTCRECPGGCGVVVKNREGRAIKIEGNPNNPISSGSTCARAQASLQGLYNPDRNRSPLKYNEEREKFEPIGWEEGEKILAEKISELVNRGEAEKIVYLSNSISGTLNNLVNKWLKALGGSKHYTYETFSYDSLKKANEICFGLKAIPEYKVDNTDYLLSFGADFLETWVSPVNFSNGFSKLRTINNGTMGKVVQVEPRLSLTAASADKWVSIKPGTELFLALGIANVIVSKGLAKTGASTLSGLVSGFTPEKVSEMTDVPVDTINDVAKEFTSKRSLAIGVGVAATGSNSTETQIAINLLNYLAGNFGKTVDFSDFHMISNTNTFEEISGLVSDMQSGKVELLIVHSVNPSFTLPKSLNFDEAVSKVPLIVSLSSFMDETSEKASLILPESYYLEAWGDYQPTKGYVGLVQPAMHPVFNTKSVGDIILSVSKKIEETKDTFEQSSYYDYLRDAWKAVANYASPGTNFERFWKKAVKDGGVKINLPPEPVQLSPSVLSVKFKDSDIKGEGDFYFVTYPSYRFFDGVGANKPWLQELPEALTTSVWDSYVEIHPETAKKMGIEKGTYVNIKSPYGDISTQAFIYEGIRPDTVAVPIGLGHKSYGRYAKDRGVNPIEILPASKDRLSGGFSWLSTKVAISNSGKHQQLVQTQYTMGQDDRKIAQTVALSELGHHKDKHHDDHEKHPDFYPEKKYNTRWGMTIDLSKCTACGSCVTACYAENNIPFVGKQQVAKRREMSWLRINRFFEKDSEGNLDVRFLPMLCQQCGNAPCEPVCPVYATYHNHEGLNGMVYNRCVGTRYCANNCTYKVRRFNWYSYSFPEPLNWQLNPDVTVRTKGVMEKCTFCVQRIQHGKDIAKDENRKFKDGEIQTACQQACPTGAIVFGDLMDSKSEVTKLSHDKRAYTVLEEINTKPGIKYLKKVKWDKA